MKKFFLLTCLILAMVALKAQDEITVKFTSTTQIGSYCPFNAVNVSNLSRNWEEVLVYPDTTLLLQSSVGVSERNEISSIEVYPNPFSNWTDASFSLETAANVKVQLFQLTGKEIASYINFLEAGTIQVRITMSQPQMALLVITTSNSRQVAKVLNVGNGNSNSNSIEVSHYASKNEHFGRIANLLGDFMPGDTMRYEAVAYDNGNMLTSEVITKAQYENETIVLSFNVTQPEVSTFEVSNITQTSALGGGEVTLSGGLPVIERGICWSTQNNPSINGNHSSNGNGIGAYTVNMYNLSQNTTYYVRAYAINGVGISYGQEVQFTTSLNVSAPTVMTSQVTSVTQTSAVGGGNVTDDGGASVTERGICWGTGHNPSINNNHSSNGSGLGSYTVNMTGLSAGTTYYVRAYAINSQGISYGQEVSFTTTAFPPTVTTSQVTEITQTSAIGGGNVTDDGGGTVTERGICWSTSHNPTTSSSHGNSGSGTGSFSVNMSGLSANTTYYVRAYAINNADTAYGSEVSFTTLQNVSLPTVTTSQVTNITQTTATGGGNVTSDGGGTVTERGICWSTSHNPTTSGNHANNGTGTGSYTINMTGLTANTTYYVRAYATNSVGTAYGSEVSFITSQATPTYTITVSANPSMAGSVSGGGSYQQGQSCTVTATATSGYTFVRWTENGTQVSTNASYTFTVTSNRTLVANFNLNGGGSHEYVNLGLPSGTLWATCNVGASSPEDYGAYFAWGETQIKDVYNWSTYVYCHGTGSTLTKYCNNSSYGYNGFTDNLTTLLSVDDAATANWGADWRMPTSDEWSELQDNTNAAWTMQNGVYGWLLTATNGNSLFLPAAGGYGDNGPVNPGTDGGYWSSSLCTSDPSHAWYYYFWSGFGEVWDWSRDFGRSVRAVFNSTPSVTLPSVTTSQVTNISQTTATGGGNVTNDGGGTVTERGICWSTSHNPTTSGSHANSGTGTGSYSINMTGLTANTTYYVRAYATNSAGTAYGSEVSFTTLQNASLPTVTTSQVNNITQTTATGGGNVTATGGSNVTERGICWSASHNPTTSGNHANSGTGTGSFTINMTGLTANTTYYVRAYATNSAGTAYGSEVSFTTLQDVTLPTVTTSQVTNITQTSATGGGNVISSGGGTVTERGICWSTNHNPTTSGNHASNGTGTGSFSVNMNGLSANTTYYVRAYAVNSLGTAYGSEISFVTLSNGNIPVPNGAIDGLFTINNSGGKVYFSQGNLQYKASTNTWRFATNQWDYVGGGTSGGNVSGSNNSNISPTYNGWIDLFGWGTSGYNHGAICYQPYSTATTSSYYYAYGSFFYDLYDESRQADWGYNALFNGGNQENKGWRTLTKQEWNYLFYSRNTISGVRFAKAIVDGVNGVILLPDDWDSNSYNLNDINTFETEYSSNTIGSGSWTTFFNGAVFLPAAGYRSQTYVSGWGSFAYYWSASYEDVSFAYCGVSFGPTTSTLSRASRDQGCSVRLVHPSSTEVKTNPISNITRTTAVGYGNVVYDGGATVTERGVCWSTNHNPTIYGNHSSSGAGIGPFTVNITGLTTNSTYYVRAYATNGTGIYYGNEISFTSLPDIDGTISQPFSVSSSQQVWFSQGNLQYQASTNTWRFAENQWDYVGTQTPDQYGFFGGTIDGSDNSAISSTYSGWIDLFGWGTSGYNHGAISYQPYSTATTSSYYYAYGSSNCNLYDQTGQADWGYNAISNGGNTINIWRSMTKEEWNYMLFSRSGIRYAKARVNGVNGLIILPDDWCNRNYGLSNANDYQASFESNIISLSTWADRLEAYGAVFLPASGSREGTSVSFSNNQGVYWSSTCYFSNPNPPYYLRFSFNIMEVTCFAWYRYNGLSVRLVHSR